MSPNQLLLMFRVVSALLLLAFMVVVAWLMYQDMKLAEKSLMAAEQPGGLVRVVANSNELPAVNAVFPLLPVTSVGRGANNTIVLPDGYASNEHALLMRRNGQWWLQDQGSRNGTLLNQLPVQGTAVISAGDIISIGGIDLKIEF